LINIVVLNGGRGAGTLIPSLLNIKGVNLTSIVNAYDDGKSTGAIRNFFGMLGPSDIRKVQELMLPRNDPNYNDHLHLFTYRYPENTPHTSAISEIDSFINGDSNELVGIIIKDPNVLSALKIFLKEFAESLKLIEKLEGRQFNFSDCSIMNCIYAGAFLASGRNIEEAASYIGKLFNLDGSVLSTSIEDKKLMAIRENGEVLYNEADIVELRSNVKIERIFLLDKYLNKKNFDNLTFDEKIYYLKKHQSYTSASNGVTNALQQADIIIYSAGTQHSSLYPTYLLSGLAEAIADNQGATKIFITNIGADYETPTYKASDYLIGAFRYLNLSDNRNYLISELFNSILVNKSNFKTDESYVEFDESNFRDIKINLVIDEFESQSDPGKHDGKKLTEVILQLFKSNKFIGSS
jgi:2-phospho-L-lactate transferase/gluconeogenesis factor (CofD/UPF0052 family)